MSVVSGSYSFANECQSEGEVKPEQSNVRMTDVLSWHQVSPHKRIILSKRLSTPSEKSSKLVSSRSLSNFSETSGDFRKNKIFPADLPDCDPPRLKDVLSFTSSLADSDIGTSVSQDLSLSRQSDRLLSKSARTSSKPSRSSLQSAQPCERQAEAEAIFTIECLEVREGEESDRTRTRLSDRTEYSDVTAPRLASNHNSYRKYIIKKDHNHRKNRAVKADPQQTNKDSGGWQLPFKGPTLTGRYFRRS